LSVFKQRLSSANSSERVIPFATDTVEEVGAGKLVARHLGGASCIAAASPYDNTYGWFLDMRDGRWSSRTPSSTASRSPTSGNASRSQ
jgi:hypothetical protein